MKTLFIDTHLNDILVFLLDDGKVIDKREIIGRKNNSEVLMPTVIDLIDNVDIGEILVVNGPGSFTSIRLGVTVAKTLAYTMNIPIKTLTSLQVSAISNNFSKIAISDGNGFYLGEFDNKFKLIKEYIYVNNSETSNIEDFNEYIKDYKIDIEAVYTYLKNIETINAHDVNPIYVKKIGVEIDKKG